ncbi:hypothetical protein L596_008414 [Steinernema carpocapsae]|uniref:Dynamin-type G domain-containing protein n=1 Tax=Steinernema carpocapsae TaxID=34508 RepID=A0A4U5PDH3_STECR|nr:hypothetical protein L596_008414 [Steinernema carpocapsae]
MSCCAKKKVAPVDTSQGTLPALNKSYQDKVKPAEKRFLYDQFATPSLAEGEILAKPIVLLLGQYSVGKTSMIKYLLNGEYPGAEIGPEPTTDIFAHIQYSENTVSVEGPTLIADKDYSLKSLEMFGETFLNKLRSTNFKADLLQHMSIIDTPGILSGEKQIESRGYDFASIIRFLADRVDRILLMFDANKLDISDEYKQVILCLAGHDEKIKIVLNKADSVKPRELIMVRGALMWSLGKILTCPEVPKVFTTSMWQYEGKEETPLTATMREDTEALLADIMDLPNTYKTRRINDLVRRTRMVRIHSYVMHEVLCTGTFGIKVEVATNPRKLIPIYRKIERNRRIVRGDLPSPEVFHKQALKTNVKDWKKLNKLTTSLLDTFLNEDITVIVEFANKEEKVSIDCKPMDKIARAETPKSTKQALAQKEGQARDKVKANDKKEDKEGNKEDEKEKKKSEKEVKDGKKQAASKKKEEEKSKKSPNKSKKESKSSKDKSKKEDKEEKKSDPKDKEEPKSKEEESGDKEAKIS